MSSTFIEKLVDWKDFEIFIKKLYEQDENLDVEHDVTLTGKSGAKRQIDVLITQKTRFHEYKTLIECKRWKEKVDRSRVDILFASIEDLNASKGAIFTTSGFEEGAELYAQSKNIDLFVVRDLTPEEWGLPGREIHFYMQAFCGKVSQISLPNARLLPVVEEYPTSIHLDIVIEKEQKYQDEYVLHSKVNGIRGPNLVTLLLDKQAEIHASISNGTPLIGDAAQDEHLAILSDVEIDFSDYEFRQLRYPYGVVDLDKLTFKFVTHVSQNTFHFDRGRNLDIALTVENYIRKQKHLAIKRNDDSNIQVTDNLMEKLTREQVTRGAALQNGSILKVIMAPYVEIKLLGTERSAKTDPIVIKLKNLRPPASPTEGGRIGRGRTAHY